MGNNASIPVENTLTFEEVKGTGASPRKEGHGGGFYKNALYFFGGVEDVAEEEEEEEEDMEEDYLDAKCTNEVHEYNVETKEWKLLNCSGEVPAARSGCICSVIKNYLFVFGGTDPIFGYLADGYQLNLDTLVWEKLHFQGSTPSPRDKASSVLLPSGKLLVFGGFGPQTIELQEGEEDTATFGWFNETYTFDIDSKTWELLSCSGNLPTPRAAMGSCLVQRPKQTIQAAKDANSLVSYTEGDSALFYYVFGGRDNQGSRVNDVFSLEIDTLSWDNHNCRGKVPSGRSFHSCISIGDKIVLFGGADNTHTVLNDVAVLDTRASSQHAWVEPKVVNAAPPRAFFATIQDGNTIYFHGGTSGMDTETGEHLNFLSDLWKLDASNDFF